jgi:hypothetical protein
MIDWHTVAFLIGMASLGVVGVVGTWWAERPVRKFWKKHLSDH